MIFLLLSLIIQPVLATDLPGEELWTNSDAFEARVEKSILPQESKKTSTLRLPNKKSANLNSNLPHEYMKLTSRQSTHSELIQTPKGAVDIFRGLKIGDIISVTVPHSVIAFPDEKSPVIGIVRSGQLSGFKFIGESYLEPNSKRIFINFSRLVIDQHIYEVKGIGVSSEGQPGLTGEYHSREAEYFTGDFIASFAAGYFDGLVPRRTNVFGQTESDSSVDSAVKKGLASGALSTANRFREKLKKVPEFSEIKGSFKLKVLVLEQAKAIN